MTRGGGGQGLQERLHHSMLDTPQPMTPHNSSLSIYMYTWMGSGLLPADHVVRNLLSVVDTHYKRGEGEEG